METLTRSFEVELPIGLHDDRGRTHRTARLRKMTGREEALLYDASLGAAQLVTELLGACVVGLGDLEVDAALMRALYAADRSYLLLELRRVTLGDQLRAVYVCPGCRHDNVVEEDLGHLEVRRHEGDAPPATVTVQLTDGWRDRRGVTHTEVELDLPRGADEEVVSRTAEQDPLRARDALLLRCIRRFGDLPRAELDAYGMKILRELPLGDRRALLRAVEERSPGVHFRRRIRCHHCGAPFDTVLDATAFFELS